MLHDCDKLIWLVKPSYGEADTVQNDADEDEVVKTIRLGHTTADISNSTASLAFQFLRVGFVTVIHNFQVLVLQFSQFIVIRKFVFFKIKRVQNNSNEEV